jgi:exonuclease SbcC
MTLHVEKTLGLDFEKLRVASIVQQGELSSIIKAKGKEFKELLNAIIGIDKLDTALSSMRTVQREFRTSIQEKFGYDDTQVQLLENKITEYENETKNAQPRLEQLATEKEEQESLISKLEKQIQDDWSKESHLKELESRKNELIAYSMDVIKSIKREVSEKEEIVNECKPCFALSKNKNEIEEKINKIQKEYVHGESELANLVEKQVRLEEHEELAEKLVLKDGKCPVCAFFEIMVLDGLLMNHIPGIFHPLALIFQQAPHALPVLLVFPLNWLVQILRARILSEFY